ncbi:MAG TPA: hypothetical protein VN714_33795 [Trebonia sp.]|jgi:hypothetical protein|nr:hypothetical protein [Trebonia sp.]
MYTERVGGDSLHPEPALVRHRIHDQPVPARRWGTVLFSDEVYHRHAGPRRYFWLLGEDVQLVYEPFGWRDEWYVDLVSVSESDSDGAYCYTVSDELVDIVVEGTGPAYRIIDLDEIGDALATGRVTAAQLGRTLASAQRFLDRYLHRGARFPPPQIAPFFAPDHEYPFWSHPAGPAAPPRPT